MAYGNRRPLIWLLLCSIAAMPVFGKNHEVQEVVYSRKHNLKGYLAVPKGKGPHPVAIYHHGGLGDKTGGPPKETALALAEAGYIGFSPLRRKTMPMKDAIEDAAAAMSFAAGLKNADTNQVAVLGFSRGGFITFYCAAGNPNVKAVVVMASAPGRGSQDEFFNKIRATDAPALLLVAENDNNRTDLVALTKKIRDTLDKQGKKPKMIVYPPYGTDGHKLFFQLGDYWKDVLEFLETKLRRPESGAEGGT